MTNKQLFETYVTQEIDTIYRFALAYMRNREEAEDVVGESVLKGLQAIGSLRDPSRMTQWFFRIVANTAKSALRKRKRVEYVDPVDLAEIRDPSDSYSDISFRDMTELLDTPYRIVIVLRFFEDLPLQDIAEILGENLNTVKSRLYKALRLLRVEMGGLV